MSIHLNSEDIKNIDSREIQAKILAAIARNIKQLDTPGVLATGIDIYLENPVETEDLAGQTGIISQNLLESIRNLNPGKV